MSFNLIVVKFRKMLFILNSKISSAGSILFFSAFSFYSCSSGNGNDSKIKFNASLLPSAANCDQVVTHKAFTLCYSEKDEEPRWVAYLLTKEMCETNVVKRKDKFIPDPLVKTGSAESSDYKSSGFDRGHLCPAGDMNWSEQTMEESFYMSNMSPQVHGFNAGIWEKLEGRVRKWASQKNEVLVICGGVLREGLQKIGVKNKISVPEYFYKIIYTESGGASAIGFIIPNQVCTGKSYIDFSVSVDSVEKFTGIDFFPALPDTSETRIEKNFNRSSWLNK